MVSPSAGGQIRPDPDKLTALSDWPTPKTVPQLRSWLGFVNYFRKHLPDYASLVRPLHALTTKGAVYNWTDECQRCFDELTRLLQQRPCLQLPRYDRPFVVVSGVCACVCPCTLPCVNLFLGSGYWCADSWTKPLKRQQGICQNFRRLYGGFGHRTTSRHGTGLPTNC